MDVWVRRPIKSSEYFACTSASHKLDELVGLNCNVLVRHTFKLNRVLSYMAKPDSFGYLACSEQLCNLVLGRHVNWRIRELYSTLHDGGFMPSSISPYDDYKSCLGYKI